MKKRVAQIKFSPMAGAPNYLCKCINKYSDEFEAVLLSPEENTFGEEDKSAVDKNIPLIISSDLSGFDFVHFHNRCGGIKTDIPKLIHYHSPPYPGTVELNFDGQKVVEAQYQATLPEYRGIKRAKNIIDFYSDEYKENYDYPKIRIGFSPSMRRDGRGERGYESKGYLETLDVLNNLKKYKDIEIDIIEGVNIVECIKRKSECCKGNP